MTKTIRCALFCWSAIFTAAAGLVYAQMKKGVYRPAETTAQVQPAGAELSPSSTYEVSAYPAFAVDLAAGDGKQEVQIHCNTCHTPRYITMQPPLPAATWAAEVNKMKKTYGASIPDDSTRKIIAYLQAHYTPDTRKQ